MGIRIPAYLQDTASSVGLKAWVDRRKFPRKEYFSLVDDFRDKLSQSIFATDDGVSNEELVKMLSIALDREGALYTHITQKARKPIDDADTWQKYCDAGAWSILQRYLREVEGGLWP